MKKNLNNKLLLKILSAIIAIFLWVAITYTEDPIISQTITGISISFEGEDTLSDRGLIITNRENLPDISVIVRGNRSSVISSMGSISAIADVSGISTEGSNIVSLKYNYPSSGITLIKSKTQEITLETEKLVSRSVPVKFKTENQEKNLTHFVDTFAYDDTIKIRGAESEVYKIEYAQAVVDITEIVQDGEREYSYKFYDKDDDVVAGHTIIYQNPTKIIVTARAYAKATLPVKVILDEALENNYVLKVKSISSQSIDAGKADGTEVEELNVIVSDISKNQAELKVQVPEGIYIPEEKRAVKVEYQVVPKVLKEIEVEAMPVNIPEGITLKPKKIKISVKGAENEILVEKIKAEFDITEQENGKIPVKITLPETLEVVGSYVIELD